MDPGAEWAQHQENFPSNYFLGCIPHCSVSSSQPLLSLCIHFLQLQRFPWSDHWDLPSLYSPNKLKRLFPSLFTTKAFGFLLLPSSFESSLTLHTLLEVDVSDLMVNIFQEYFLWYHHSGIPAVSQLPNFRGV